MSTASRILDKTLGYEYVNKMELTAWTGENYRDNTQIRTCVL